MNDRLAVCTIVARNFLPFARVLARTVELHHPRTRFVVLVVDASAPSQAEDARESFEVVAPADLGLDHRELHTLAAMYGPRELSTALKPRLLARLLEEQEAVLYLDPDMAVYAPLDGVLELAVSYGIVLTPHVLHPVPRDGRSPTDIELALTGIFNLGFVAVGRTARPFLDWWWERLRRDCIFDRREGLFVDQKWVDWVPALFDHAVLKEPEWNVAHWNAHEREVALAGGGVTVDGRLLKLFHFSGYRPESPDLLTTYSYGLPLRPPPLSASPALARLCDEYRSMLLESGYERHRAIPYGYAHTAGGSELDDATRAAYREALIDSDERGGDPPPDPFDPTSADVFDRWQRTTRRSRPGRLRRRLAALLSTV